MSKFRIILQPIEFEADNLKEAESIAVDLVNDIAGDDDYKVIEVKSKPKDIRLV